MEVTLTPSGLVDDTETVSTPPVPVPRSKLLVELKPQPVTTVCGGELAVTLTSAGLVSVAEIVPTPPVTEIFRVVEMLADDEEAGPVADSVI